MWYEIHLERTMSVLEMTCLRSTVGVTRMGRVNNENVRRRVVL